MGPPREVFRFLFPPTRAGLDSIEDVTPLALGLAAVLTLPVPFVAQKQEDTCGAASLAMVLRFWDQDVSQEQIIEALLEPELRGIPGSRLAEFARERGLRAVPYEGDLAQIRDFVEKGRPLIVAWKVGRDLYHNVVVTGFDDDRAAVIVNDPAKGPARRVPRRRFEERWAGGNHWTLLVLPEREPYVEPTRPVPVAQAAPQDYESLVALGISLGKQGKTAEAAEAFSRAIALDPGRPEARVERGGLRFIERRYDDAVRDLEGAMAVRKDGYTRNLLASSYHLVGRSEDALREWNELGQPVLGETTLTGFRHIHPGVARRELTLESGEMLDVDGLRESRLRLQEVGVFSRVVLRPVPRQEGRADLEVAVHERHAFGSIPEFAGTAVGNALVKKVRLRYFGLFGSAINLGAQYRWEKSRPKKSASLDWARFLGIPAYFHFSGERETQSYDVGGLTTMKARGVEVGVRRVLDARTVMELGFRTRDRDFSVIQADTPPGVIRGLTLGLEHRFWDSYRRQLDWSVAAFKAGGPLHSDVSYPQAVTSVRYEDILSPPDGTALEKSVIAARALGGWAGDDLPLDEMFAPGAASEMEFPLRGHKLRQGGIMGQSPLGRTLGLFNVEWRQRVLNARAFQAAAVLFYDAAHIGRTAQGQDRTLEDVGFGLRVSVHGVVLRADYGFAISGGRRRALTAGFNQVF
jgi:predicted double-glycine peptidase